MCAGVLLHRWGSVDIEALTGRGRAEPLVGVLFVVAGIGLVGLPPFGTFVGKELIEESASSVGYGWVVIVFVVASGLSAAAGLRAAARVFLDLGRTRSSGRAQRGGSLRDGRGTIRTPLVMLLPIVVLVVVGAGVGCSPVSSTAESRGGALRRHLRLCRPGHRRHAAACQLGSGVGRRLARRRHGRWRDGRGRRRPRAGPDRATSASRDVDEPRDGGRRTDPPPLRAAHSGHIGDYIAWLTVGVATFGGILAAVIR